MAPGMWSCRAGVLALGDTCPPFVLYRQYRFNGQSGAFDDWHITRYTVCPALDYCINGSFPGDWKCHCSGKRCFKVVRNLRPGPDQHRVTINNRGWEECRNRWLLLRRHPDEPS